MDEVRPEVNLDRHSVYEVQRVQLSSRVYQKEVPKCPNLRDLRSVVAIWEIVNVPIEIEARQLQVGRREDLREHRRTKIAVTSCQVTLSVQETNHCSQWTAGPHARKDSYTQTLYRFVGRLPSTISGFKKHLLATFPVIYDTKLITNFSPVLFNQLKYKNSLSDCYKLLIEKPDPIIRISPEFTEYSLAEDKEYHEAGFDALATGVVCFKAWS